MLADDSLCRGIEVFAVTRSQSEAAKRPPPPPIEAPPTLRMLDISRLTASIMSSKDKLFFVTHRIPGSDQSEWALVRIDLQLSINFQPACLQDGCFLAQFQICYPAEKNRTSWTSVIGWITSSSIMIMVTTYVATETPLWLDLQPNQKLMLQLTTIQITWKTAFRRSASRVPNTPRFSPDFIVGVQNSKIIRISQKTQKPWNISLPPWWIWFRQRSSKSTQSTRSATLQSF